MEDAPVEEHLEGEVLIESDDGPERCLIAALDGFVAELVLGKVCDRPAA